MSDPYMSEKCYDKNIMWWKLVYVWTVYHERLELIQNVDGVSWQD